MITQVMTTLSCLLALTVTLLFLVTEWDYICRHRDWVNTNDKYWLVISIVGVFITSWATLASLIGLVVTVIKYLA